MRRRGEGSRVVDVVFPPLFFFFVGHLAPFNGEFGRGICKQRERGLGLSLCVVRSLGTQSRGKIDAYYIYTFAYLYVCVFTIHSLSFVNIIVTITSLH